MSSSGKKKTTMAKLARENRLRERRLDKQARKDARKNASAADREAAEHGAPAGGLAAAAGELPPLQDAEQASGSELPGAPPAPGESGPPPTDPRAKEVALSRLRDAPDAELAVFGASLRDGALAAGASEQELREAQREHPGHGF